MRLWSVVVEPRHDRVAFVEIAFAAELSSGGTTAASCRSSRCSSCSAIRPSSAI